MSEPIRVRVGKSYNARYNTWPRSDRIALLPGPLTPQSRLGAKIDNVTLILRSYDLIHSFNAVPVLGRTPFVVTFEDLCPRVPPDHYSARLERWLRGYISSDRCRAIIAMSQFARAKFVHQHRDFAELDRLLAKTHVVLPGIAGTDARPKPATDRVRLLFVGKDFLRKGGSALVEAHRLLRRRGVPVETTIVSALRWRDDDYVGPPDPVRGREVLDGLGEDGIVHHLSLPNAEVRALMARADYLVLPTFHDTFGYVTVEAMLAGTPAIVTATCAQPEIVDHGRSGWLLDFDTGALGEWRWLYRNREPGYVDAFWAESEALARRIADRVEAAWEARADYEGLSAGALAAATERFDPVAQSRRLEAFFWVG